MACKKTITKNWYQPDTPNLKQWMDLVKKITLRSRRAIFSSKWKKWTTFIKEIDDATQSG